MGHVAAHAAQVSSRFALCDSCLGRLYLGRLGLTSCKRLGARIRRIAGIGMPDACHICRGLCQRLGRYARRIGDETRSVEFSSFMVGATLRPSMLDRDDQVRSAYRLKGAGGIKSEITGGIARALSGITGARIDHDAPDLTVTVDFRDDTIHTYTRPVAVSGRYVKRRRGVPQRRPPGARCGGAGCGLCPSVEGQISEFLCGATRARQARISWTGGEDKESLVLGDGRPFLARMINPRRRSPRLPDVQKLRDVELGCLLASPDIRPAPARFSSLIRILVSTEGEVASALLRSLKDIPAVPVMIYEDSRINQKRVYSVRYRRYSPTTLSLLVRAQGGLPVKRFVEGGAISPSVADLLETGCACRRFDFLQVNLE